MVHNQSPRHPEKRAAKEKTHAKCKRYSSRIYQLGSFQTSEGGVAESLMSGNPMGTFGKKRNRGDKERKVVEGGGWHGAVGGVN